MFSKWGLSVLVLSLRIWGNTNLKGMTKQEKSSQLQKVLQGIKSQSSLFWYCQRTKPSLFIYFYRWSCFIFTPLNKKEHLKKKSPMDLKLLAQSLMGNRIFAVSKYLPILHNYIIKEKTLQWRMLTDTSKLSDPS